MHKFITSVAALSVFATAAVAQVASDPQDTVLGNVTFGDFNGQVYTFKQIQTEGQPDITPGANNNFTVTATNDISSSINFTAGTHYRKIGDSDHTYEFIKQGNSGAYVDALRGNGEDLQATAAVMGYHKEDSALYRLTVTQTQPVANTVCEVSYQRSGDTEAQVYHRVGTGNSEDCTVEFIQYSLSDAHPFSAYLNLPFSSITVMQ